MSDPFDISRYRASARGFKLRDCDPGYLPRGMTKEVAEERLLRETRRLRELQERLFAIRRWSLLVILQGMDAAGKDGIIEHVFSGVNPQGCEVHAFKAPSEEELDHDYLWRTTRSLPPRGDIGIFNRSYYEEVLVVRVNPHILDRQRLPPGAVTKHIWRERYEDIVAFERHMLRNGTMVRKIFLHVSRAEQRKRLLARVEDPAKAWKFSAGDLDQRRRWVDYMEAYEDTIRHTTTKDAPWYVVPADAKWWARTLTSLIIVDALERMDLRYPAVSAETKRAMQAMRRALTKPRGA